MIQNYLKIAWRNLEKNRAYAFINTAGLAIGLGCALLIFALVRFHYQIDQHHHQYNRIYQLTSRFSAGAGDFGIQGVPYPLGQAVRNEYPDVKRVAMLEEWYSPLITIPDAKRGDKKIKVRSDKGAFVEPSYFKIFDYHWLAGGPEGLTDPGTVVMSADMARKCFGSTEQVIGKVVRLNARIPVRVIGVFSDYRDNTDLAYAIMPSWATLKEHINSRPEDGRFDNTNGSTHCYVLFGERFKLSDWNRLLPSFVKKYNPEKIKETTYPAMPFSQMHLSPEYGGVSKGLLLSLVLIGLLLIGTACINFVNLATAQAINRAREVGVRKVLGSTKIQLFWQFMGETTIIVLSASILATVIFYYGQALAQAYLNGPFRFTFYSSPAIAGWLAFLVIAVILSAGLYPALVLAGYRPVAALAGRITSHQTGGFSVRRGLVVTQFAISQMLIIGLIVVASQLRYVQTKNLGFSSEAILTVSLPDVPAQDLAKMQTFRNLVTALPDVGKISYSMGGPPQSTWTSETRVRYDSRPEQESFGPQQAWVDAEYVGLYDLKLAAGRNLQPSDTAREALINESFVRQLGVKSPADVVGKYLHKEGFPPMEIVGVLKDYNQRNLRARISPLFLTTSATGFYYANIKLRTNSYARSLKEIEKVYNQVYSDSFFESSFVNDQIQQAYQQEQTMSRLINCFAAIALLIGCMGLYGLVLFMVGQRTKEVGVRKVLGASVTSIMWMFSREFIVLIGLAFLIAAPVAWWVMNRWLSNFEYKTTFSPVFFLSAFLITTLVTLLTVGFKSLKAAIQNPVQSLKNQ